MKALVLAAGCGRRLWPLTASTPKCLLRLDGATILGHQMRCLRRAGVSWMVIVSGHGARSIRRHLAQDTAGMVVQVVYNPFYAIADNLVSLWIARAEFDDDLMLLNGDAVLHPRAYEMLASDASACSLLLARKQHLAADDMKVCLEGAALKAIGKDLAPAHTDGVAIGATRFRGPAVAELRQELDRIVHEAGSLGQHFPLVVQRMVERGRHVHALDMGDLPWADVDTPADLEDVRTRFGVFLEGADPTPEPPGT